MKILRKMLGWFLILFAFWGSFVLWNPEVIAHVHNFRDCLELLSVAALGTLAAGFLVFWFFMLVAYLLED